MLTLFYFVGLLCLLTAPVVFAFFAGRFFFGSVAWMRRLYAGRKDVRHLLGTATPAARALLPARIDTKKYLDGALVTKSGPLAIDHAGVVHDVPVSVRAQSMVVDERGQRVGFPWTAEDRRRSTHVLHVCVVADLRGSLPTSVTLHADALNDEVSFGDDALYCGFVTGGLREVLRQGDQITFGEGNIVVESPFAARDGRVAAIVEELALASRRLVDAFSEGRPDIGRLLLDNVKNDGSPTVRARSVDRLLQTFVSGALREEALEVALVDSAAEVRFAAARHLGKDGFDVAVAIVRDEEASEALRERALRFLMRRCELDDILPILHEVLGSERERLRLVAVRHLGELRYERAVPWLCDIAPQASPHAAAVIATALGTIGSAEAELTLISLYEKHLDDVKIAVADALAWTGTLASIPHLTPDAESVRVPHELRMQAANAIAQIRLRVGGVSGALSVLDAAQEAGHLSLDPGERGSLSDPVPDKPDPIELAK